MSAQGWTLPQAPIEAQPEGVVRTGPSGLLLGHGRTGPITIRLFRPVPTRLLLAVPEYVTWLLAFRCISLGAHLSIVATERRRWQGLADTVTSCGGTAEFSPPGGVLPGQGRPYRPSLIIDDAAHFDGSQVPLGRFQAVMVTEDASSSGAIHALRSCDMALVSPCDARTTENLRRAYVLTQRQLRLCQNLEANEVVLAMPRRLVRLSIPPTPTEYTLLFGRGRR
jgi:hypothetical protein